MVSLERNIQLFCLLRAFVEVFRGAPPPSAVTFTALQMLSMVRFTHLIALTFGDN